MSKQLKFTQYLHKPLRKWFFEADDMIILGVWYGMIMLFSWKFIFVGPVALFLYKRAKQKNPRGFLKHQLYNLGFLKIKDYPSPFVSKFEE